MTATAPSPAAPPRSTIDAWFARLPDPMGWVFWVSVIALLARSVLIAEPIIMDDEYYYAKTSQLWWLNAEQTQTITGMPGRGAPSFPNSVYFAIYQFCFLFGPAFYTAAKILNVIFVAGSAFAVARVARLFTDRFVAGWIGVLILWLPSTAYAVGFMAEPLYECIVWCGLLAFFSLVGRDHRIAAAALGAFLAAAYLTKPTAIVLLMTGNAVVAIVAWRAAASGRRWQSIVSAVACLNLAFVASGFVLNAVLTGKLMWDPVGRFYRQDLSKAMVVEAGGDFAADAFRYVTAYSFFVLLAYGSAVTVLLAGLRKAGRTIHTTALAWFAAIGVVLLVLGTSKASMNWERLYEGGPHIYSTRYMSVLFPLLLIAFATFYEDAIAELTVRRWVGAIVAMAVAGLAFVFADIEIYLQLHEVFWTRGWDGIAGPRGVLAYAAAVATFAACAAYYGFARRPHRRVYAVLLAGWAMVATMGLFRTDLWNSTDWLGPSDRAGRIVNSLVSPSARDNGLVVFDHRWRGSSFMFRYSGFVPVRMEPANAVIERDSIPLTVKWVVFLGPVQPAFDSSSCVRMPSALWCPLSPDAVNGR